MKILHVISALASGGAEIFVKDLCIALKQQGHDVAIAYAAGAAEQGTSIDVENQFKAELAAEGIAFFEIGHSFRRNPVMGGQKLRSILKSYKPDLLHIHLGLGILFYSFSFCRLPTLYTHHSIMFRFNRLLTWWFDRFVRTYVAICDKCHVMLISKTSRPIVDIRNGISGRRVAKPDPARGTGIFKIISVGSIREAKDYPTTVAIAARVKQLLPADHRPLVFLIYGEGEGLEDLRALAENSGVSDIVRFENFHPDIPAQLAAADVLLMSSIYEGLPISLIEATHAGLPMIATDVGGCPEIVRHGENGLIFHPRDIETGAAHVLKLHGDPELCAEISRQSFRIADDFSMSKACRLHIELYEATLGKN